VNFFFGTAWQAPLVLVVLAVFAAGLATGALGMVPRWWKHRRQALKAQALVAPAEGSTAPGSPHGV